MAKGHFLALFGRILTRVGKGVREPARDVLLTGVTRPQFYGKMFGFHRMMDNLGAVLGPLMGLLLIKFFTINNVFLIAALPVFGAVFIIILFIKEPNVIHEKKQIGFKRNELVQLSSSFKQYCWAVGVFGLGNCAASLLVLRSIEMLNPLIGSGSAQWYSIMLYALLNFFYAFFSYPMGVLADTFGKKKDFVYWICINEYWIMGIHVFHTFSLASHTIFFNCRDCVCYCRRRATCHSSRSFALYDSWHGIWNFGSNHGFWKFSV